jgi:hypothetical protein
MEWRRLESQAAIAALMRQCHGFHDGCFREAHVWAETSIAQDVMTCPAHLDTHVRALFQLAAASPSAIELRFDQVVRFSTTPSPENCDSIIASATFSLEEGIFLLRVYLIGLPLTSTPNTGIGVLRGAPDAPAIHIASRQVSWRDASEWMGDTLRYCPESP